MKKGFFLISDITGYTDFLTKSELDHASDIISAVMKTITEEISLPLRVSNYQGDAILMYAPEENVLSPQSLIHQIESIYFGFRRHLDKMHFNTSCACKACKNIPGLDLKFFVHYGEYTLQSMGDREELTGPDVILVHRLMKNNVVAKTGVSAYAMFTEQAAAKLPIDLVCDDLKEYEDSFQDQGILKTRLLCLHTLWGKELKSDRNRVKIPSDQHWIKTQVQLTVSPEVAWGYATGAEHKKIWLGMDKVEHTPANGRAYGNGSKYHCAHGEAGSFDYEVMDWRPFEYLTIQGIAPGNLAFTQMDTLEANEQGTLYRVHIVPRSKGIVHGFFNTRKARKMREQFQGVYDMTHAGLRDYIIKQEA